MAQVCVSQPHTRAHCQRQCRTERKLSIQTPLNTNAILYKNRISEEGLLMCTRMCTNALLLFFMSWWLKKKIIQPRFYDYDLPNCWHVHISRPLICHRTLRGLCASVLRAAEACLSLASCGSAAMQAVRRPRAKRWSCSSSRGRGQGLFTGQTPRVRDTNITVSSRRRRPTQRVTWGEGKLRRVFGETSKWYLTESAVCSNVYCTNDLPEHRASQHTSSSCELLVNRSEWLQPRNYLRLTNNSSNYNRRRVQSRAFLKPCSAHYWV